MEKNQVISVKYKHRKSCYNLRFRRFPVQISKWVTPNYREIFFSAQTHKFWVEELKRFAYEKDSGENNDVWADSWSLQSQVSLFCRPINEMSHEWLIFDHWNFLKVLVSGRIARVRKARKGFKWIRESLSMILGSTSSNWTKN